MTTPKSPVTAEHRAQTLNLVMGGFRGIKWCEQWVETGFADGVACLPSYERIAAALADEYRRGFEDGRAQHRGTSEFRGFADDEGFGVRGSD